MKHMSIMSKLLVFVLVLGMVGGCAPVAPTPAETQAPAPVETTAPPAVATQAPAAVATQAPVAEKVTFVYGSGGEPSALDPCGSITGPDYDVFVQIYEPLVNLVGGKFVPALAKSWTVSDDGKTWTFKLQEVVKFHDGTEFDAEAVKANFDRYLAEAALEVWKDIIDQVKVVDKYTVEISTKEPNGGFLYKIAAGISQIVSPAAVEKFGEDFPKHPVGTGPFKFDSWVAGEKITLVKNPDYWREGPFIDVLEFRFIKEGSTRVMGLEAGDLDAIQFVPVNEVQRLKNDPKYGLLEINMPRIYLWAFNMQHDYWKDPRIRIALNYAIDRDSLVKNVLLGVGTVANSWVQSEFGGVPTDLTTYDPEKAKSMLTEAGFDFTKTYKVIATEGRYVQDRQVAEAIQGMLAKIGVKVDVEITEFGLYAKQMWDTPWDDPSHLERDWMATTSGQPDAAQSMSLDLRCDKWPTVGYNDGFYCNKKVDDLFTQLDKTTDQTLFKDLMRQLQEELTKDPPDIITHFERGIFGYKQGLTGFSNFIIDNTSLDFRLVKFEK